MTRRDLINMFERGVRGDGRPEGKYLGQPFAGKLPWHFRVLEEALDLGTEVKAPILPGVEKGPYPDPVTSKKKFLFFFIPDGNGELPVEFIQAFASIMRICLYDDLGIAGGSECVSK